MIMGPCHRPGWEDKLENRLLKFSILTWSTAALESLLKVYFSSPVQMEGIREV